MYARADRLYYYVAMTNYLVKEGYEVFFVTESSEETEYVKKNLTNPTIYNLYDWLDVHCDQLISETDIDLINSHYRDALIWRMLYSDRFLISYNQKDALSIGYQHIKFFEYVFEKELPNYICDEAISTYGSYVAYEVGQKYNVRFLGAIIDRTAPFNRFFAFDNPGQISYKMIEAYKNNLFTDEAIQMAKAFYKDFTSREIKPAYMEKDKVPHFDYKCLFAPFSYAKRKLDCRKKQFSRATHYVEYKRPWNDRIYMHFERWLRFVLAKNYYQEPDYSDNYYLFPLHFQPEATTLVCAEKYEKQIIAIDHIAKSIPFGSVLYVKEHYACLGHRHLDFYKQLSKYPNVKLITPFESIHKLIRNSKAVIVLTSTTGFEALLHKKKVFVLGSVFYQFSDNVTTLRDVYDEHEKLLDVSVDDSEEEVIRFLSAYYTAIKEGNIMYGSKGWDSESNMRALSRAYDQIIKDVEFGGVL